MGTKALLGAACCGLVIALSGCGGSGSRLSVHRYVHEASERCVQGNRAIARVPVPPLSAERAASRAMARTVVVQRRTIDELRGLRPPEHLADTVQQWIALLDQGADELERMGERLRAGRGDEALDFGAKATTLLDRARDLMAPLRVTACRGPVLPTV